MKRIISSVLILFSLILYSCSSDIPVSPQNNQSGGITLNIDRVHKPANVVSVTALSNQGKL